MYKIFVKGNYFFVIDPSGGKYSCHKGKATIYNDETDPTKYDIDIPGKRYFEGISFSEIVNFNDVAFASQDIFEDWYTKNTGFPLMGQSSVLNSFEGDVEAGGTWVGTIEFQASYPTLMISCFTSQSGTLMLELSSNGVDSLPVRNFEVIEQINEPHRFGTTRSWFRLSFHNTSGSTATVSIESILGDQNALISPLDSVINQDADATVVRSMDFNLMVAQNLYQNNSVTVKDGLNFAISTATTPQDLWTAGGTYKGFVTAIEACEIVVSANDIGTVVISRLETANSTDYTFVSVAINGAGTYSVPGSTWRSNFAVFIKSGAIGFNLGPIQLRQAVTTTNVFWTIPFNNSIGYSQTFCAAYTVPKGAVAHINNINGNMRGSQMGSLDGMWYYHKSTESPRYRFPFELQFGSQYIDPVDNIIRIDEQTDLMPRIIRSSTNNLEAKFSYRVILVK